MNRVTVTSKYRITIPSEVRNALNLRKGQRLVVVAVDEVIELVPERDINELRGAFPNLTTDGVREEGEVL